MKLKNLKVGLRVEMKVTIAGRGITAGDVGVVYRVEPDDYAGSFVCAVKFDGDSTGWWTKASQIRIADKVRKVKPAETAPAAKMPWPWPAGTLVRLTESAFVKGYRNVCVLGSDGSDLPPVLTKGGDRLCFVSEEHVTLAEDPKVTA